MADKYSTIQQYQPPRVPSGWSGQEKMFVNQLTEIFDDIYRRFGRLRIEDMGEKFRKRIADDEGNFADLSLDVYNLTLEVGDKYDKVSGITIDASGIDITGSKYVKIRSGGTFDVDATNFNISSANKSIQIGDWTLNTNGVSCVENDSSFGKIVLGFGKNSIVNYAGYPAISFRMLASQTSQGELESAIIYIKDSNDVYARLLVQKNTNGILLFSDASNLSTPTGQVEVINLSLRTNTPDDLNLNNAKQHGIYACSNSYANAPSDLSTGFHVLRVDVKNPNTNNEHIVQTIYTNGLIYVRHKESPTRAWTSWYKFTGTAV